MIARTVLIACLMGMAMVVGCSTPRTQPARIAGASVSPAQPARTLEDFQSRLAKGLTPKMAEGRFGKPDKVIGSGLLIYVYALADGREILLGFPGLGPILYAKVRAPDGRTVELNLK